MIIKDGDFTCLGQFRIILSFVLEIFVLRALLPIVLKGNHEALVFFLKEEKENSLVLLSFQLLITKESTLGKK